MKEDASIAVHIGDPVRVAMLTALMADRALTATELADIAGVTREAAGAHLATLVDAGLVSADLQGRHCYFRLGGREVVRRLESLMGVAFRTGAVVPRTSLREPALRKARVCYDHLAGELAVAIHERLLHSRALAREGDSLQLTDRGRRLFAQLGLGSRDLEVGRRSLCKPCLDGSERRDHLAGPLGAMLLTRIIELGWAIRVSNSRIIRFSAAGERSLGEFFALPAAGHHFALLE